jgi:hypothetical protein
MPLRFLPPQVWRSSSSPRCSVMVVSAPASVARSSVVAAGAAVVDAPEKGYHRRAAKRSCGIANADDAAPALQPSVTSPK